MLSHFLLPVILRRGFPASPATQNFPSIHFSLIHISRFFSSPASNLTESSSSSSPPAEFSDDLRSRIFRLRFPKNSATSVIEKWEAEGRKATAPELRKIARDLRRSQRFKHALEISEWIKSHEESELSDDDYAMRIDLITKVFGVSSAEEFFEGLPSAAKSGQVNTALLHSYAGAKLTEKAENLFERIKDSNLPVSILMFNEMMTMYISVGQLDRVHLVVEELKKRNVSPDLFTYNLWISACAASFDVDGVRKILSEMALNLSSDDHWRTYAKLTDIYISAGPLLSSDNALVESEKKISQREWITYDFLILLYASLGNINKINEIWKALHMTSQKMTSRNYICILSAYLVLGKMEEASKVIEEWKQSKVLDFDESACDRLFDGFVKVGLMETAESFRGLIRLKNSDISSSAA